MPTSLPDWPTKKDEAFKYTDLSALARHELPVGKTELKADGAVVTAADITELPDTPLVSRALAQVDNSWLLEVAADTTANLTLDFAYLEEAAYAPKVQIKLGKNSQLTLTEKHTTPGALVNALLSITLDENASLEHIRVQDIPQTAIHLSTTAVSLARNARYKHIALSMGASLARHEVHITITATGAEASVTGLNLLSGTQQGDLTIVMRHQAPHCNSQQLVRSVLGDAARYAFQGQIQVAPDAQKTNAQQQSRALLLSPQAEMNVKPELEIFADDVVCGHGATIGNLDETALFYLRARGIPEAEARKLLITGFIAEALAGITDENARLMLEQMVQNWLDSAHAPERTP